MNTVTISKAFYMQTTEVTQGQWNAVMGSEPWEGKDSVIEGPKYPAVYVSRDDAVAFCEKLSEKESMTYRLPTEAEWEYACRAGTKLSGIGVNYEKEFGDYAWYDENSRDAFGEQTAHEVGLKCPMRLDFTTCSVMYTNGATIITERITTNSRHKWIQWVHLPALPVYCGEGRIPRVCLVTLIILTAPIMAASGTSTTSAFALFVSWISSVVILDLCNSVSLDSERGAGDSMSSPLPKAISFPGAGGGNGLISSDVWQDRL
jgi:hypothetical protein